LKKKQPIETPVVDPRLMREAKEIVFTPRSAKTFACRVCGSEGATQESESLCWVCRRLKVSAWRDIETQLPMNE